MHGARQHLHRLEAQCRKRQSDVVLGRPGRSVSTSHGIRPPCPSRLQRRSRPCDQATGRIGTQVLVHYKTNDYSVQVAFSHRDRGYVDAVEIGRSGDGEPRGRHRFESRGGRRSPRRDGREDAVFDP